MIFAECVQFYWIVIETEWKTGVKIEMIKIKLIIINHYIDGLESISF